MAFHKYNKTDRKANTLIEPTFMISLCTSFVSRIELQINRASRKQCNATQPSQCKKSLHGTERKKFTNRTCQCRRVKKTFLKNHAQLLALSWVVDLEVLGPGSRVPGSWFLSPGVGSWGRVLGSWVLGFRVLGPHFRLCHWAHHCSVDV